jgi:HSP20 family protein
MNLMPRSTVMRPVETDLFEAFDRLHSRLLDTFATPTETGRAWMPALADLEETDDAFVIHVEVPGFDRDDIKIELMGRRLTVHAEREEQTSEGTVHSSTRSRGHLHHEVLLPADADDERVEANLDQGVLTIRMNKREGAGRKQIEISSSS